MDFNNAAKNSDTGPVDYGDFGRRHLDRQYVAGQRLSNTALFGRTDYLKSGVFSG